MQVRLLRIDSDSFQKPFLKVIENIKIHSKKESIFKNFFDFFCEYSHFGVVISLT